MEFIGNFNPIPTIHSKVSRNSDFAARGRSSPKIMSPTERFDPISYRFHFDNFRPSQTACENIKVQKLTTE
jgi:hypothetical protein